MEQGVDIFSIVINQNFSLLKKILNEGNTEDLKECEDTKFIVFIAMNTINFEIVTLLIEAGFPLYLIHNEKTLLHIFAQEFRLEGDSLEDEKQILDLLISKGIDLNAKDKDAKTALHYALENGSNKLFSELLSRGADPNLCPDGQGTLLHIAIKEGKLQEAKILLERGVDPDIRDSQNFTSLHIFAEKYNLEDADISLQTEVLSKLIERSDLTASNALDKTALYVALESGNEKVFDKIKKEIEYGIDGFNSQGMSPMHIAAKLGDVGMVRKLFNKRADINLANKRIVSSIVEGETPLHIVEGETPLHIATKSGYHQVVKVLLSVGANPNVENDTNIGKDTPLHLAVKEKKLEVIKAMVEYGNDKSSKKLNFELKNAKGKYALDYIDDPLILQKFFFEYPKEIIDHFYTDPNFLSSEQRNHFMGLKKALDKKLEEIDSTKLLEIKDTDLIFFLGGIVTAVMSYSVTKEEHDEATNWSTGSFIIGSFIRMFVRIHPFNWQDKKKLDKVEKDSYSSFSELTKFMSMMITLNNFQFDNSNLSIIDKTRDIQCFVKAEFDDEATQIIRLIFENFDSTKDNLKPNISKLKKLFDTIAINTDNATHSDNDVVSMIGNTNNHDGQ